MITKVALHQGVSSTLKAECKPHKDQQVRFSISSSETETSTLTTPDKGNSPLTENLHGDGNASLNQMTDHSYQVGSCGGDQQK